MSNRKTKGPKKRSSCKKKTPTVKELRSPRQLVVVKKLSAIIRENKGNKKITMGKLMREAGYSPTYSKHVGKLVKSKTFQELLEEYLPDDMLSKTHANITQAKSIDHRTFPKSMTDKEMTTVIESVAGCKVKKIKHGDSANHVWFWMPDNTNRLNAIKEAYKVKNKYPAERHEHQIMAINVTKYDEPAKSINPTV